MDLDSLDVIISEIGYHFNKIPPLLLRWLIQT